MIHLYILLDVVSTVSEYLVLYVLIRCFCKKYRFSACISGIVPFAACGAAVCLTWFTDLGAVKSFFLLLLNFVLVGVCCRISFYENLLVVELFWLLAVMLPEAAAAALMSLIYQGEIMAAGNDAGIVKWQVYAAAILLRFLFLAAVYPLLKSFRYRIRPGDAAVLTSGFLLAFVVSFAAGYGYLNLRMEDTLIFDLAAAALCVSFIIQFIYSKNVSDLREQEQLDQMRIDQLLQQFSYYQEKCRDEERVCSIYHDMKNHLLVLQRQAGLSETAQLIEKLQQEAASYEDYIHTGNDILDMILKEKAESARKKQTVFSVSADFTGVDFIEPLDISTIFGNGLDNALEACGKLPEEKRAVLVKCAKVHDFFSILIENNCLEESMDTRRRTKKQDDFLHGFGILNMEKAVEKYGGQLTVRQEKGRFTLKILIPVTVHGPGGRS